MIGFVFPAWLHLLLNVAFAVMLVALLYVSLVLLLAYLDDRPRASMEAAASRERHRVRQTQRQAEQNIHQITNAAVAAMIAEAQRARREPGS